ncbi:TATA box-binding protein-associated factor RNA polymerase I subunit A-like isoform X2 [Gigantopelta aegis]|uniref:TATA box-binding protein-associated factor RNA polymerase I subunit A-like isoform X2 n=1 Tax=Gigantopelta aegis TaxID=1735272 RepID=UPI001B88797B|nr:TATA box-binding protein-associated factor RNA polymerase I subunit A-like isoform X2 [Gigantopelta aegis]
MDEQETNSEDTAIINELLTLITEDDDNPEWFTTLSNSVSTNDYFHALKSSNHFYLVPRLFKLLQECLVTQRWSEALKVMNAIATEPLHTSNTIWRAGMEILYANPSGNMSLIGQLTNQLKVLSDINGKEVVLEYFMYLLTQGHLDDAKKAIQSANTIKRHGQKSNEKSNYINTLLRAYQGLVWYVEWLMSKQRHEFQTTQDRDNPGLVGVMSHINYEEKMKLQATKAVTCFQSVINGPGVWDIFITKYIELLEYMQDEEKAHNVLLSYCEKNEDNPNAYCYLYEFQIRQGESDDQVIKTLSLLADKDPSNKLVLDLCNLIKDTPKEVEHLFNLLDYPMWNETLLPWQQLLSFLENIKSRPSLKVLDQCWNMRKDWWPNYVWNKDGISTMDREVMINKALVASALLGRENAFTEAVLLVVDEEDKPRLLEKVFTSDLLSGIT